MNSSIRQINGNEIANRNSLKVIKEGYVMKRGEFIKNWRSRYFALKDDGILYGYKEVPSQIEDMALNVFDIQGCLVLKTEKPKANCFVVQCSHHGRVVNRLFNVNTRKERDSWVDSIRQLADKLEKENNKNSNSSCVGSNKNISDFVLIKVLGRGTFGKVVLAQEKETGEYLAIKILRKDVILAKGEVQHTLTENKVLQNVKHPFLTNHKYSFQTNTRLFFAMEFVNGGELFFHLSRERIFSEERTRFYAAEIISALKYLHENKIVYRDLKLENLLLDGQGHIKIADFGLCKQDIGEKDKTKTFCGTPEYLAPEVIEDNDYGRAVDWWGLGVVLYEMLWGRLPFYNRNHEYLFELILKREVSLVGNISEEGKSLVGGLLRKKPEERLGGSSRDADEIMEHVYFYGINWTDVFERKLKVPFIPTLNGPTDTKYFDEEFTKEAVQLTPPTRESGELEVLGEEDESKFEEFDMK